LAETIKADGLLQAITVRRNIHKKDYFVISYGERRFRAVCLLGHPTIAAVIDDNFDPYRQAIENLQREELDPLDIADWVEKREAAGDSRITIAKRLGKPKSYISEIALLIKAPPRSARPSGVGESRTFARRTFWRGGMMKILPRHHLAERRFTDHAADRDADARWSHPSRSATPTASPAAPRPGAASWNSLAVQVAGREGTMVLKPGHRANQATVQFADGSQEAVVLSKIRLKTWMAV